MADRLEVRLHREQIGWIARGSRRERIEFEWADGYTPGPVTLTESFGSVRLKAPSPAASSFFGGYALEGRQRERLTQRRGISNPADLYAMLREFGSSIAGAVTVSDPDAASRTQPTYEPISDGEIIRRLQRAANDGDLGSDDQSRSMLAGLQPKLLLARFDGNWYLPHGRAHSTHILKPRLPARPDGLAREYYGHALAAELGLARYRTELVGKGARQYLVIERYDRAVEGQAVTLIHQEDAAQALGLDWVDDQAKFQDPSAPRDSHRRDHPPGRTPGRWPGPAGHGRSGGCGPGCWGAAGSGCSERPRHYSSITLSDTGGLTRTRALPPICSANLVTEVAADATPNGVICVGSGDGSVAGQLDVPVSGQPGLAQLG